MKATFFAVAVAGLAAAHEGHDEAPPAYNAPPAYDAPQPSVSLGEPKVFTATPSVSLGEPLTFTATPSVALGPPKYFTESAPTASSTASSCPAPGDKDASGRYSCNPAHSYPDGQYCTLVDGCYFLRTVGPGVSASASVPVSYETKTVSEFTTFCPSPTTFVHSATTYAVTAATTIVIPCPGGCAVTKPVTTAPGTAPAPQPTLSSAVPSIPVSRNGTTSAPPAIYTGAANKMLAGGAPLAAAALGAFFL